MKDILYNCRKATFLIEKKNLTTISVREQVELKIHLAACSVCKLYQQQSGFINKMVKKHFVKGTTNISGLDDHFKDDLANKIKVKMADEDRY
ncbi:MAG: hypothetical protein V4546_12995 [Bacteroidota bacterium]